MKSICIIPCGRKKIWDLKSDAGPTRAKDVYIGTFTRKCQEYAEIFYPNAWYILSAKYGFLSPKDIIPGPYNVTFNKKKTNPISNEELFIQANTKRIDKYNYIVVLGGKNYVDRIAKVFSNQKVLAPLKNCKGIGYMMGKLNDAIIRNHPIGS